ncbi:unnamed protein product [Calypogeia fissa]
MNSMVFAIDFTIKPPCTWGRIVDKFAGGEELRQPRVHGPPSPNVFYCTTTNCCTPMSSIRESVMTSLLDGCQHLIIAEYWFRIV